MNTVLLLGNEAVARGALDAGLSCAYGYPGTPATEAIEYLLNTATVNNDGAHCEWTANEKSAFEAAAGASMAGRRALVCMKHVGVNVAADALVNTAVTGVRGGLVLLAADDPSMHSSQNEQDTRYYAKLAQIPLLEPIDVQQAYAMTIEAFDMSERMELPVIIRLPTRISHARGGVVPRESQAQNAATRPPDPTRFILVPFYARKHWARLTAKSSELLAASEQSPFNSYRPGTDTSLGIVAAGVAASYVNDCLADRDMDHPVLQIGHYPIPDRLLLELTATCDRLLVVEEGAPIIETVVRHLCANGGPEVLGRLNGSLPRNGELTPDDVADAVTGTRQPRPLPPAVPGRPPTLCKGCPHIRSLAFVQKAMLGFPNGQVFSDIGCYALPLIPPESQPGTCINMGASISMAKGCRDAGIQPVLAIIGDSTFTHSGMPPLLDIVCANAAVTVVILDNGTVAMTGGQVSSSRNRLEAICGGLGVSPAHIRVVQPSEAAHAANVAIVTEELMFDGPSVVISRDPCIHDVPAKGAQ